MLGSCLQAKYNISNSVKVWFFSHGMDPTLGRSLVGLFLHLCSIFVPAFLLENNSGSNILKMGW